MKPSLYAIFDRLKPAWLTSQGTCLLCLASIKQLKPMICVDCQADLPTILQACSCCGLPIPYDGLCGQCLKNTPAFHQVIAAYRYDFPVAQLISKFKYQQQWPLGHLLAHLLVAHLTRLYPEQLDKPDYLLAVPLSKTRLKERGFNQAELLAKWLSKPLAIPLIPDLLRRVIDTPPQQTLSAKERYKNLKHAFQITNPNQLADRHIAIVDDVVTTGTTANRLATLCRQAGAKRVDIYTIARTPHTFI